MTQTDYQIVACPKCGAKNRLPADKMNEAARCGKCGSSLSGERKQSAWSDTYTVRCSNCRAKNRIPANRIDRAAKCGKCKSSLDVADLLSGKPVMVTDATFDRKVMNAPLPVLLYCWSPT